MRNLFGCLLVIGGIIFAAYVGVWLCFIGGIVQVIEVIRAPVLIPMDVAIGIAKFMFSGLAFALTATCFVAPGMALLDSSRRPKFRF
jgi:hypothetical protein